jgi:protein gp37
MSKDSAIEWTGHTWNPIRSNLGRHYCERISPGCDNCYAATMTRRLAGHDYPRVGDFGEPGEKIRGVRPVLNERALTEPLKWRDPAKVFVCSMTDLFGEWVPDEWLDRIFAVMALSPRHTFQVLTKRPKRMAAYLASCVRDGKLKAELGKAVQEVTGNTYNGDGLLEPLYRLNLAFKAWPWPLLNVWLGTSIEEDRFTWRADVLAETPAAVRFISAEPLLGPLPHLNLGQPAEIHEHAAPVMAVETREALNEMYRAAVRQFGKPRIDWLIVGGESNGPAARRLVQRCVQVHAGADQVCPLCDGTGWRPKPEALAWVRDLRDRSAATGTAFFFKQWGGPKHDSGGRQLDGQTWDEFPATAPAPGRAGVGREG